MCTDTRTSSYGPVGPSVFYCVSIFSLGLCFACLFVLFDLFVSLFFCVSLGSWVISLTVFGASVTNLNEPHRALATSTIAPCGLRVVRIDPLRFLAGCRTRRLNQVLCLSYILACYIVLLFIRSPFYVLLVFVAMCSVFWLFWLSYHYLPSDWLERLLWGSLIVVRGSSPESPGRRVHMIFLVYCIA